MENSTAQRCAELYEGFGYIVFMASILLRKLSKRQRLFLPGNPCNQSIVNDPIKTLSKCTFVNQMGWTFFIKLCEICKMKNFNVRNSVNCD